MKKLICDVCGTAYPDSAEQCPICGSAKPVDGGELDPNAAGTPEGTTYTYVKGGRFSKSNVRKRNKAAGPRPPADPEEDEEYYDEVPESSGTKGLMIAVIVLLLAIIAVVAYIVGFLMDDGPEPSQTTPTTTQTQTTAGTTAPTTQPDLRCTAIVLENSELVILAPGETVLINAAPQPADTTDVLQFISSDPSVATVSNDGAVTAVAPGEVEILVTCGDISETCRVSCQFEEQTTEPEETVSKGNYIMCIDGQNVETRRWKNEVSIKANETFKLTIVDQDTQEVLEVQWVSGNATVATVSGNTVTGVFSGSSTQTKITCTVGDKTFTCIVRKA